MKKALLLLTLTTLLAPAAFSKAKKKKERDPNAPDISAKPGQIIGKENSRYNSDGSRKNPGYSQDSSHRKFQKAYSTISENAEACRFSYNTTIALSLGGKNAQEDILGRAAAIGQVYKKFSRAFGSSLEYSFDEDTSANCTTSKKAAKKDGRVHIDEDVFKWSPGVLMAAHTIGKTLDRIGWDKVEVDGIQFVHVNANGSRINQYNITCEYVAKKSRKPWRDFNYYYEVKIDLGNHKTNLDQQIIEDCITSNPRD